MFVIFSVRIGNVLHYCHQMIIYLEALNIISSLSYIDYSYIFFHSLQYMFHIYKF